MLTPVCLGGGGDRAGAAPTPVCHLLDFGDSAVDLELRVWIKDPVHGVTNVLSEVRLAIRKKFRAEGITMPFPQRDLRWQPDGQVLDLRVHPPGEQRAG